MRKILVTRACFVATVVLSLGIAAAAAADADMMGGAESAQCIPLSSITALSLQPGMTQTRRRNPNVPTLNCVGNCPDGAYLAAAQCRQTGLSDNGLPSWKCDGVFPGATRSSQFRLGSVRVQCEGCSKPGDSDVVKGSCALTYSVETRSLRRRGHGYDGMRHSEANTSDGLLILLVLLSMVGCCYCVMRRRSSPSTYTTYEGVAVGPDGKPIPGGATTVQHHHYGGGGYGGGGGFGTGMFTGFLMGDMMSRAAYGGHHGGYYGGGGDDYDYGGSSGGGDWGGGGGWGGTDSV